MILLFAVWLLCGSWLWRRVLQLDAGDGGCSRAYVFVCIGHAMSVLCHIVEHAWAYFPPFVNLTFAWVCVCSWLRFWCGCEWAAFEYGLALRVWLRVLHVWRFVSVCGDDDDHDDYNTCIVEGGCMWPRVCRASMWSVFAFTFVRIVMHANAWLLCLCLIGYVPSHLNICMLCIALLVKRCSWLWTYGDDGSCLRKYPEILFKQYFGSYSAFTDHPPLFLLQNHVSFCCLERCVPVCICYVFEQYFWVYRQWL